MSSTTTQQGPQETRVFNPPEAFVAQATVSGMDGYNALCAEAEADYEGFWARLANEHLAWQTPFTRTLNEDDAPFYNCLLYTSPSPRDRQKSRMPSSA